MVQLLLGGARRRTITAALALACVALLLTPIWASRKRRIKRLARAPPELILDGGRKLVWERSFESEK